MNEQEKQDYLEKYKQAKEKGEYFFPDAIFKDAVIALIVFLLLVSLAYFIGAPLEARADPADTNYTPRPEWYFLFLFQLLKYFPGQLEVVGVVLLPTLAVILLFLLPVLDRGNKRHAFGRPIVIGITAVILAGIVFLTIQAYQETPPPVAASSGDQIANLYLENCAGCHGQEIKVKPGINLHTIISQGSHEEMPAWNADLTTDQIDALAGFILSPRGNTLFLEYCGECHDVTELVAINPLELKNSIDQGIDYVNHQGLDIPEWTSVLSPEDKTALLNFLVAPDGQRLFTTNCSSCHGKSVAFQGEAGDLRNIISQGGMHLEMPPWRERISDSEIGLLARYVVDPNSVPEGELLFEQYCSVCHGSRIPQLESVEEAKQVISTGGPHETMPVWGDLFTSEQLDALVAYTLSAAKGTSLEVGQKLFNSNCAPCHGEFGEGGVNPAQSGDIIAPISTREYMSTRDDFTLRAIISEGQPNLGMSPFATNFGGPLSDEEIDAIVAFLRSWEENPPVEVPPEVKSSQAMLDAEEIFADLCSQCHGSQGEGGIGPALSSPEFQDKNTDSEIFDTINLGHEATAMIGWGDILSGEQIQQLVTFIRKLRSDEVLTPTATPSAIATPVETSAPAALSFDRDILPVFAARCNMCHGASGGWDGTSYEKAMSTGENAPVIIPGDIDNSLLAQKLLGTQTLGALMPPAGKLPDAEIQIILNWIKEGAKQ